MKARLSAGPNSKSARPGWKWSGLIWKMPKTASASWGRRRPFPASLRAKSLRSPGATFALRSPIAGRVVERKVTPGLVVKEDEELFTVADTSALWCFVQIPEKDLLSGAGGAPATVTISSLPGEEFPGRVDYLADMVDKATPDGPGPGAGG